jgi:hypothetical protein
VLLVKLKAMTTREAAIKRRSPPRKCVLRSLTFRRIESSSCLTPTPLRRTIPVDDKQQTVVSQYTYTKVYERSFMEVLYISAACCNEYLIFRERSFMGKARLWLHRIHHIQRSHTVFLFTPFPSRGIPQPGLSAARRVGRPARASGQGMCFRPEHYKSSTAI